jgi:hypothetical protein
MNAVAAEPCANTNAQNEAVLNCRITDVAHERLFAAQSRPDMPPIAVVREQACSNDCSSTRRLSQLGRQHALGSGGPNFSKLQNNRH